MALLTTFLEIVCWVRRLSPGSRVALEPPRFGDPPSTYSRVTQVPNRLGHSELQTGSFHEYQPLALPPKAFGLIKIHSLSLKMSDSSEITKPVLMLSILVEEPRRLLLKRIVYCPDASFLLIAMEEEVQACLPFNAIQHRQMANDK